MRFNNRIYCSDEAIKGWSTDFDHLHYENAFKELGYRVTESILSADLLFLVSWNYLMDRRIKVYARMKSFLSIFQKFKIAAVISNDLRHQEQEFDIIKDVPDIFVYTNQSQKLFLFSHGVSEQRIIYNPFYVDEKLFCRSEYLRIEIANRLGINHSTLSGKYLIGSFQRDSLGSDLTSPKWQKNPDLLLDILYNLKREDILLILAGPRRHYMIKQCIRRNIPYIFIGDIEYIHRGIDDINVNTLSLDKISLLYNLIDVYIVSSKSEGGPKAVIEAALTKTPIISTRVGLAEDYLTDYCLYENCEDAASKIIALKNNKSLTQEIIRTNYAKAIQINNWKAFVTRVRQIAERLITI